MCAATLAKYASLGHKVFIATATNGNIGSARIPDMEEIARVRKEEAKRSAAIIGAEYICLDYDEMFFEINRETRLKFINLVRYCKADIIFTHSLEATRKDSLIQSVLPQSSVECRLDVSMPKVLCALWMLSAHV